MADTAIAITAGSGTNVDTRTEATNGNHRQVVVLGDPATNTGVAPVDATAGLKVDLGADNDVTVSSIAAGDNNIGNVDVLSIVPGTSAANLGKAEDAQHSSGDTGVMALGVHNQTDAAFNSVDLDYTPVGVTGHGHVLTAPYAHPATSLNGTASATGTSDTSVIAAQGAGVRIYVTSIFIANLSATDTYVNIKDNTTTKLVIPAPKNSGAVISLPVPLRLTANAPLQFASGASVTTMHVSAVGYSSSI